MINAPRSWSIEDEYKDVQTVNMWKEMKEAAEAENEPKWKEDGKKGESARARDYTPFEPWLPETDIRDAGIQLYARDHARTPMQWDASPQAGFSTNEKTWMRVMDSYVDINAAAQVCNVRFSQLDSRLHGRWPSNRSTTKPRRTPSTAI